MFKINLTEPFPLLSRAPIVEAVIGVTARAVSPWEESAITEQFKRRLPDYPGVQSFRTVRHQFTMAPNAQTEQEVQELAWRGLRCESENKLHVAQFNNDGFTFSRLSPYQSWEQFCLEGLRLWDLYKEIALPSEMQRIGLRYINRIEFSQTAVDLEDYLQNSPQPPKGMDIPFEGFLHQNTLAVPGYPYGITVIQTIQPSVEEGAPWGIILDVDIFTIRPMANKESIAQHLADMRWLKNKVFFGSITPKTLEMIK